MATYRSIIAKDDGNTWEEDIPQVAWIHYVVRRFQSDPALTAMLFQLSKTVEVWLTRGSDGRVRWTEIVFDQTGRITSSSLVVSDDILTMFTAYPKYTYEVSLDERLKLAYDQASDNHIETI